jgi:biopolymer transport protein ExbD
MRDGEGGRLQLGNCQSDWDVIMKIKGAKQVHYDSGPNMTPLVDIVMVILIFLMLAGNFGSKAWYLTSKSIGKGGVPIEPPPGYVPDEIIELQIIPDSTYGFKVLAGDINSQGRVPDRDWLVARMKAKMAQYEKVKTPISRLQVVLFPSANARYEHIAVVYEAALAAKFEKVAFRTQ